MIYKLHRYEEYAERNHFEVSKLYREKRFTEYRGMYESDNQTF